jgi:hypothetical protein
MIRLLLKLSVFGLRTSMFKYEQDNAVTISALQATHCTTDHTPRIRAMQQL